MNQEKVAEFIKKIRKENHLTQAEFALKYGVTYQAVSKWENGKNIPDISILKQMCEDFQVDLNDLLEGSISKKKSYKWLIGGGILTLIVLLAVLGFFFFKKDQDVFQFKTLSSNCDNFNLYGSMAYDNQKTSIYISNVTYCGGDDQNRYATIECVLYEMDGKTKEEVSRYTYDDGSITLEEFLQNVSFHIDHYSDECKMYLENGLQMEIHATKEYGEVVYYQIPLTLKDNCR